MKSCDCVFVFFNVVNGIMTGAEYQINSAYIRCYLERHNYATIQYINQTSRTHNDYLMDLCHLDTKNYVFYINEYNFNITKIIINRLKKILPEKCILILGPSAEYIACFMSNDIKYDISLVKHAHYALQEIMFGKLDKQQIYNIYYREKDEIIQTEEKDFNYSLDDLGLPYSEGFIPVEAVSGVGMLTSEGCFGDCVFCSYKSKRCTYHVHDIGSVIIELDYISEYASGKQFDIRFLDDCFSISQERTLMLLEAMKKRKYNFKFWCCIRADVLSEKILNSMSELNFKKIVIGLETASLPVLEKIGKVQNPYTAEQYLNLIERNYKTALKRNLSPILSVNFGLPNELWEDAVQTIEFITALQAEKNVSICFMTCFPGSRVFEESDDYNVRKEISPTGLSFRTFYNNYSMQALFDRLYDCNIIREDVNYRVSEISRKYTEILTGIYPNMKFEPVFETIFVDEINSNNLDFINRYLDLNGTIIFNGTGLVMSRQYYCDDRKLLKVQMRDFDSILEKAYNSDCYIPNQDNIKIINNYVLIQHNSEYLRNIIKIRINNLNVWDTIKNLIKEADEFFETDKIDLSNIERFNIYNMCRFTGSCSIKQLRNIKIKNKNICAGCSEQIIGNIYDDYTKLLANVRKMKYTFFYKRNCRICDISKWCPKCMFPDNIGYPYHDYCEFMKENKKLLIYLKVIYQIKNHYLNLIDPMNSQISVYIHNKNLNHDIILEKYILNDEVFLVQKESTFYILHLLEMGCKKCSYEEGIMIKNLLKLGQGDYGAKSIENFTSKLIQYNIIKEK